MGYWEVVFIVSTSLNVLCDEFLPVLSSCKHWDRLNFYSDVAIGDEVLHCIFDQDKIPGIVYTEWTTIPSGNCPIYNRHAKLIDGIPCNTSVGDCPTKLIKSYEAVDYTGCFQMPHMKRLNDVVVCPPVPATNKQDMKPQIDIFHYVKEINKKTTDMVYMILAAATVCTVVQLPLFGICVYQWYKRTCRQQPSDDVNEHKQTWKKHEIHPRTSKRQFFDIWCL